MHIFYAALVLGGSKALLVATSIPMPLQLDSPPQSVLSKDYSVCKGAVLAIDFHPTKRYIMVLCYILGRINVPRF